MSEEIPPTVKLKALFDQGDYEGVIAAYRGHSAEPGDHRLAALAYFQSEQYEASTRAFERALSAVPENSDWRKMRDLASNNAVSEVNVPVPEVSHFSRESLLSPPSVPEGALPTAETESLSSSDAVLRGLVGNTLGRVVTFVMNRVIGVTGGLFGYSRGVWTNWYQRPHYIGILVLGFMREELNRRNLHDVYPRDRLVGFAEPGLEPPPGVTRFRTADGTWNNLANPKEGAAKTRFSRNVQLSIARPESAETILEPSPREVSRKLLSRQGEVKEVPFLNMLAASWIQFQNHDWINHGENIQQEQIEIPLAPEDPARDRYGIESLLIPRTQPDPTRMLSGEPAEVTFVNEVTHWWDASQIYGSDQATLEGLRSGRHGKMRINDDRTLPLDSYGIEETGFTRNWWLGLAMLHNLFVLEHNAICSHLHERYSHWDDNRLFNVARLINAALIAKIHSVEWTPAILPNPGLAAGLDANWYGLLTNILRSGRSKKTVANINVHNPEMGGVVGNPIDKHGSPFSLTEEFVEIYRIHSLLPEVIRIRKVVDGESVDEVPVARLRQAGSAKATSQYGMTDLFYSFGNQHPGQIVLNNYPAFMQELSVPGSPLFDMGTIDILRCRERGVPRYNQFRRQLGLNPIEKFEDLTDDAEQVQAIKQVYGDRPGDVEKLDLMVGTLAESHRPTGFGFGETMFQIFILNASRRLQADRFYTDSYNEETYTPEGLEWIDSSDLKTVILRHFPELVSTGLANVKNAFEPWDTGDVLDPSRHPLRRFDKELRPDPFRVR